DAAGSGGAAQGAIGTRPPVCAVADAALYCAAPGVKAARLRLVDGARAWSVPSGAPDAAPDEAAALVPNGGLLHTVSPGAASGGGARLEALDPGSGAVRWGVGLGAYAQVVHSDGTVLTVLADGRVRALDAATGVERWTKRLAAGGAQWVAGPAGGGAPARTVFAAAVAADGASTLVTAVDPANGTVRWSERLKGSLTPVQATADALVLLSADKEQYTDAVVRLDTRDRSRRRVALTAAVDQAQAAVDGDTVYVVGSGGALTAVDLDGRTERWRLETGAARVSRPVVAPNGHVVLSAGDGRLLAVDATRGVLAGQTPPRMAAGGRGGLAPLLPAPVVTDGKVFASAPDGSVFAVEADDPARW
uniref:outer membrane protein assembly factor BamB family protein n=1 Tax=Streptomyces sp. TRM64462 TaxID=2741726 RepID=UPI00158699E6